MGVRERRSRSEGGASTHDVEVSAATRSGAGGAGTRVGVGARAVQEERRVEADVREMVARLAVRAGLTPAEKRMLPHILCGWRNDAIAEVFEIGREGVKTLRARLMSKVRSHYSPEQIAVLRRQLRHASCRFFGVLPGRFLRGD